MRTAAVIVALLAAAGAAFAEPVRNGNEVALAYSRADDAGKARLRAECTGRIHTFRYLQVTNVVAAAEGRGPVFATLEPSSDMTVLLKVSGAISMDVASTVVTGDAVTVKGRIASIGEAEPAVIVVDPALVRSKDRTAPKAGKELMNEFDPRAR